jgi:hypothetical protein
MRRNRTRGPQRASCPSCGNLYAVNVVPPQRGYDVSPAYGQKQKGFDARIGGKHNDIVRTRESAQSKTKQIKRVLILR